MGDHGIEQMSKLGSIRKSLTYESENDRKQHFTWVKLEMICLSEKTSKALERMGLSLPSWWK